MKRRDWIKILERNGWYFKRDGGNHDIYTDGTNNEPVSRQKEINDQLIRNIMKRRNLKK
ncbi:MAG: type II toxin-antitoxin system HicA family toxin [Defluviitaleaceae bacterium]|nr:type II toxin-antitoxin system HicA family toxin [Defluviitaleaceae bacterium]MCL2604275.1 type II toxin-antitoxin system HicA family toxin [Defluviitaleaceae bacterium]